MNHTNGRSERVRQWLTTLAICVIAVSTGWSLVLNLRTRHSREWFAPVISNVERMNRDICEKLGLPAPPPVPGNPATHP